MFQRLTLPVLHSPTLSAITPLRARLMPATAVESPKTPSLEDVGLSAAVMSLLQPGQTKIPTASTTAPRELIIRTKKKGRFSHALLFSNRVCGKARQQAWRGCPRCVCHVPPWCCQS